MAISASDVKALRDATGAGMMDCKKALSEAEGDVEKAMEILRASGLAKAGKRAGDVRIAAGERAPRGLGSSLSGGQQLAVDGFGSLPGAATTEAHGCHFDHHQASCCLSSSRRA